MATNPKPTFSKRAFWSDDYARLDPDSDADYMIARVFDAGTYEDMQEAIRYYTKERIRTTLTKATDLQSSTINYAAIWLEMHPNEFMATQRRRLNPAPYQSF